MELKSKALSLSEKVLIEAIDEILIPYAKEYVMKSENKWDDLMLPFLPQLRDALVNDLVDRIDGEDDHK